MYRVEEVERDMPNLRNLLKATQVYREIQCISKNDSSTTSGCLLHGRLLGVLRSV